MKDGHPGLFSALGSSAAATVIRQRSAVRPGRTTLLVCRLFEHLQPLDTAIQHIKRHPAPAAITVALRSTLRINRQILILSGAVFAY
jgi:hypothetical protein